MISASTPTLMRSGSIFSISLKQKLGARGGRERERERERESTWSMMLNTSQEGVSPLRKEPGIHTVRELKFSSDRVDMQSILQVLDSCWDGYVVDVVAVEREREGERGRERESEDGGVSMRIKQWKANHIQVEYTYTCTCDIISSAVQVPETSPPR
eukprot:TRINITY_DN2343_c1_g1_i2.p1 TRINITY_DN2343_c1_g1~~TRINITY_DN2343_c1_g1_i2.p1  ORF type:complete len:156 (+),score=3.75 TRINITY_DN2343_c1_g1_i2:130-597(+)